MLQLATAVLDTGVSSDRSEGALSLTNVSLAACELSTTPVFELVGSNGTVMVATAGSKVLNDLIRPGEAQGTNLNWKNWCGADLKPLTLAVNLPNGGGTLTSPYGDASTVLPACTDPSRATELLVRERGSPDQMIAS